MGYRHRPSTRPAETSAASLYIRAGGLLDQADRALERDEYAELLKRCRLTLQGTPKRQHAELLAALAFAFAASHDHPMRQELAQRLMTDPALGGEFFPTDLEVS